MKKQILLDLENYLDRCSLNIITNDECDLFVQHNFVNKKWLGGAKTIDYQLMIGIDDKDLVVYALEKVLEQDSGFSFGVETSSYSQKGTKVYRKVKAQKIGLDGLAYSMDLDLGTILKEIKNIALKYNYAFKEVLSFSKIKEAHLS